MAVTVIDKIKQKNNGTFKLLDYIDINGRITGWQNPVKNIFADIAGISGLTNGDFFIVRNITGEWAAFTGLDIYGNDEMVDKHIQFKVWDASTGKVYPVVESTPTISFANNGMVGSMVSSSFLHCVNSITMVTATSNCFNNILFICLMLM